MHTFVKLCLLFATMTVSVTLQSLNIENDGVRVTDDVEEDAKDQLTRQGRRVLNESMSMNKSFYEVMQPYRDAQIKWENETELRFNKSQPWWPKSTPAPADIPDEPATTAAGQEPAPASKGDATTATAADTETVADTATTEKGEEGDPEKEKE